MGFSQARPRLPACEEKIAGIDEAGRGCLAGPVVAAAVILPGFADLPGLTDSKQLSPLQRSRLEPQIKCAAVAWSIGVVWPRRIEAINILNATLEAMAKSAASLSMAPGLLLIDGNKSIPDMMMDAFWKSGAPLPKQRTIVGGDSRERSISAASVLAKTFRDRLMLALDKRYPQYGFARHKGYGTREHLLAISAFGPCRIHRRTFRGVSRSAHLFL